MIRLAKIKGETNIFLCERMDFIRGSNINQKIPATVIEKGIEKYGDLFIRSLNFFKKKAPKITKTIFKPSEFVIWTVEGSEKDYLVYPNLFCQCKSYLIDSIYRNKRIPCKHLIAQELAVLLQKFEEKTLSDKHWKKYQRKFIYF